MFKILLAEHTEFIANAIYSYADSISNYNLRNSVKFTKSELVKMRDSLLIETCNNIYTLGINNLGNLGDYNVDGNTMQTLFTTIGLYSDQSPLPTSAIEHRKVLTDEIKKKQIEIMDFKKNQFDKATKLLRPTNASFVDEFFASSRVIDAGMRHKKDVVPLNPDAFAYMTGTITDINGEPVEDALVEVIGKDITYTTDTDEDGIYFVEGIADGKYDLRVTMEGKQHIDVFDVVFKQDDENEQDFVMEDEVEPTPTPEA